MLEDKLFVCKDHPVSVRKKDKLIKEVRVVQYFYMWLYFYSNQVHIFF